MLVRLGVVKNVIQTLVKAAEAVNMKHTVMTCDLSFYEIAYTLRQKSSNNYMVSIVVLTFEDSIDQFI